MKGFLKGVTLSALCALSAFFVGAGIGAIEKVEVDAASVNTTVTNENFAVRSAALRIADGTYGAGVRYKIVMDKDTFVNNYMTNGEVKSGVQTGLLLVTSTALGNNSLTKSNTAVDVNTTSEWKEVTYDDATYMQSAVFVYNIPDSDYTKNLVARAYVTYGGETTYSKQTGGVSLAYVATEAYKLDDTHKDSLKETYCECSLTYYSGTNTDGTPKQYGNTQTVYYGDKLTAPTDPTHQTDNTAIFEGWFNETGTDKWDFANTTVLGDTRLFAQFSCDHVVTLDTQNGTLPAGYTAVADGKYTVRYTGDSISLPTPDKAGYKFEGWYTGVDGTGTKVNQAAYDCNADVTLYADWSAVGYVYMHYGEEGSKLLRLEYPIGTELTLDDLATAFNETLSVEDVPAYETYCLGTNLQVAFNYWGVEDDGYKNTFKPAPEKYIVTREDTVLVAVYNKRPAQAYLKYDASANTYTKLAGGSTSYQFGNAATPYGTYEMTVAYDKGVAGSHGAALRMYLPQNDYEHEAGRYIAVAMQSTGIQVSKANVNDSSVWGYLPNGDVTHATIGNAWNTYFTGLANGARITVKFKITSSRSTLAVEFSFLNGSTWTDCGQVYSLTDETFLMNYIDTGWGIRSTNAASSNVVFSNIKFTEDTTDNVVKFFVDGSCYSIAVVDRSTNKAVLPSSNPTKASVTKSNGNVVTYAFDGWYLENGTKVTANTVYAENTSVYAKFNATEMRNGMVVTYDEYNRPQYYIATTSAGSTGNSTGTVLDGLAADFNYASEYEYSFKMTYQSWSGSTEDFRASIFTNVGKNMTYNAVAGQGSIWVNFRNGTLILGSKVDNTSKNNYEVSFGSISTDCPYKQKYNSFVVGSPASLTWTFRYGVNADNTAWIKFYVENALIYTYGLAADGETHTTSDGKTLSKMDGEIVWAKVCNASNQNVTEGYFNPYINNTYTVSRGSDVGIWAWGDNSANGGVALTEVYNKPIFND